MIEKIVNPKELREWEGKIELYWIYTSGKAGDEFFKKLKEDKFIASKCKKCGRTFFPPRIYCEYDFSDTEFVEISGEGYVRAFTVARLDGDENPMEEPEIYAIIDMDGTDGCLIHLLGEVKPEDVYIGMKVKPVLKDKSEREGMITDILYFKPS
ncbi:putative nucleic-acid-binding protein containing a Zn-ribbon [Archaeoglobus sulfaticallidus PM70-1]|uniref:Putative nucleic-acid-binding protein containing a Zn-ribbon n=1 Tax=Archaeoglobus sulfaticallidus PM70-1 TaxID=387631 RepID=N0BIB4_9EURY|nr:Zn-ribbon domain-containing OB-fold protein [Archaeoglobus sulfaticallidus]AGK60206.1 putative nucleic-acid-binding protein containing a Zn-ribbon [Archaeoglobus sulfaticallidus PM70-1]